jgi:quercetin dioxygenase-like cupin family protein
MKPVRRIVTGHDERGRAVFVEDADSPHAQSIRGVSTNNLWRHSGTPDNAAAYVDPVAGHVGLEPPADGVVLRVVDFPPEKDGVPDMHRTASLDYAVVLDGEIHAVLDNDETLMRTGDVLVQRGTNHAWVNRSDRVCRVLFVLIDAEPI